MILFLVLKCYTYVGRYIVILPTVAHWHGRSSGLCKESGFIVRILRDTYQTIANFMALPIQTCKNEVFQINYVSALRESRTYTWKDPKSPLDIKNAYTSTFHFHSSVTKWRRNHLPKKKKWKNETWTFCFQAIWSEVTGRVPRGVRGGVRPETFTACYPVTERVWAVLEQFIFTSIASQWIFSEFYFVLLFL